MAESPKVMKQQWRVWAPAFLLCGLAQFLVRGRIRAEHWSESLVMALSFPLVPFLIGFWITKALTSGRNPWLNALGGGAAALALIGYSALRG